MQLLVIETNADLFCLHNTVCNLLIELYKLYSKFNNQATHKVGSSYNSVHLHFTIQETELQLLMIIQYTEVEFTVRHVTPEL